MPRAFAGGEAVPQQFLGFDHIDARVWSLGVVEAFYDQLMPELGLTSKRKALVDTAGDWHDAPEGEPYNAIEYHEPPVPDRPASFIGFIEDASMQPVQSRIAFRIGSPDDMEKWHKFLRGIGSVNIERSADMDAYPAIFFEDPSGTRLEVVCRPYGEHA